MVVSLIPIWAVDVVGSILMIVFAFLSFGLKPAPKKKDPNNIIVTYLLWVCLACSCLPSPDPPDTCSNRFSC
jgi:hypothetical protein